MRSADSFTSSTVSRMEAFDSTDALVAIWMAEIFCAISSVAFGCLVGEALHFLRNYSKATPRITSARSFDCRVQGKQVSLPRNLANEP